MYESIKDTDGRTDRVEEPKTLGKREQMRGSVVARTRLFGCRYNER
jgi:hypothetical protein